MGITWRGLDISDLDGIYLEITRGYNVPPSPRGEDYVVAALPGRISGARVADIVDSILLEGYVRGADPAAWTANRDQLLATLDEDGAAPGALIVTAPDYGLSGMASASINCRVKNWIEGAIIAYRDQTWSIELESIDPRWVVTS